MASKKNGKARVRVAAKGEDITYPAEMIPIVVRPDSNPPHQNPIRAFREELRLTREEFSKLLGVTVMTVRTWETPNLSRPKGSKAIELVDLARRNAYPLTLDDIYRNRAL